MSTAQPRPGAPVHLQLHSQYGVVPKDTDGFGALLGGDQPELHGNGFVQRVLQQRVVVVHSDADHRGVDDGTLWDTEAKIHERRNKVSFFSPLPGKEMKTTKSSSRLASLYFLHSEKSQNKFYYRRLLLSGS